MNILVTGAQGQLGYDLCSILREEGHETLGVDRSDFDLTDRVATERFLDASHPDAVIHCAAFTDVDGAEQNPLLCRRVNRDGSAYLAKAAQDCGAKLLYLSTDYVFAGIGEDFYTTQDRPRPLSVYGETKYQGEEATLSLCSRAFVVRTSWVFGRHGRNFVSTMIELARKKREIPVVRDQVGSPTYTRDLSRLIAQMIRTDRYGIYHATNEGICSRAEFAREILRQAGLDAEIRPVWTADYPSPAKRPLNSRMSKQGLEDAGLARLPHWRDALARYLSEIRLLQERALFGKRGER